MKTKTQKKHVHAIIILIFMIVAMAGGIYAGKAYFSSYELASYIDTVTVKYKDAAYSSDVDVKYTLTIEYNKADGTKAVAKIAVDDDLFESCKIGDSIEVLRTDALRKDVVKDSYFEEKGDDGNVSDAADIRGN